MTDMLWTMKSCGCNTECDRMQQNATCHRLIIQNAMDYEKLWSQYRMRQTGECCRQIIQNATDYEKLWSQYRRRQNATDCRMP